MRNLPEDCIERFTEPGPQGYAQHSVHRRGETLTPLSLARPGVGCGRPAAAPWRGRQGVAMTTQTKAPPVTKAPAVPAPHPQARKFTVAEYYRMGEAGILKHDERVELVEGGDNRHAANRPRSRLEREHFHTDFLTAGREPLHRQHSEPHPLGRRFRTAARRCPSAPTLRPLRPLTPPLPSDVHAGN